jgi:gamma-glutamyltranspeptidase/glutathione hydrolase
MVTSPHVLATQTGVDVLAAGGNAVEAAIATVAALNVTYPHFCGWGGDVLMLVADAHGDVQSISGIGQAAQNVDGYHGSIPTRGARAALTTAGAADALGLAFDLSRNQWGGTRSWSELLAPSIALAREGFEVSASERFWLNFRKSEAAAMPDIFAAFSDHGHVPRAGSLRKQPQLARTLETLAERGARDMYDGQLAQQIAHGLAAAGSPLTRDDLARTQARVEPPLAMDYRGGTLLAHQPPTQGITTLQIMGVLERFDFSDIAQGSAEHYHLLIEATKQAFLDRKRFIADPAFVSVPTERLLSKAHLDALAARIDLQNAMPWPKPFQTGDTVYVGAVDQAGRAVSLLATVYYDWGSGVMVGDSGLIWHNRGSSFSLDPQEPNCLGAGKRPFHTLNPGIYSKNGRTRMVYGTQGADGQPQTLAAILTRLIDYRMHPLEALAQPRFLLGKTFSDTRDSLKIEENLSRGVCDALVQRGHALSTVSAQSPLMGHSGVIVLGKNEGMHGAHDPRSDGYAIGCP